MTDTTDLTGSFETTLALYIDYSDMTSFKSLTAIMTIDSDKSWTTKFQVKSRAGSIEFTSLQKAVRFYDSL